MEDATKFAMNNLAILRIFDEHGYQINTTILKELIQNLKDTNAISGSITDYPQIDIILYNGHYFGLKLNSSISNSANLTMDQIENEDHTMSGYPVYIDIRVPFDFETIYTKENEVQAYSLSFKAKFRNITIGSNPNAVTSSSNKTKLMNSIKELKPQLISSVIIPTDTIFAYNPDSKMLINRMISAIRNLSSQTTEILEPILHLSACSAIKFRYTMVAFNGAKFDFIPLFHFFNSENYFLDENTPVRSSGKISSMKYRDGQIKASSINEKLSDNKYVNNEFQVWDPRCFVMGSLSSVASSFKCKNLKGSLNHQEVQKYYEKGLAEKLEEDDFIAGQETWYTKTSWEKYLNENRQKIEDYNNLDVEVLDEIVDKIESYFSTELGSQGFQAKNLFDYGTLPSLCYDLLEKTIVFPVDSEGNCPSLFPTGEIPLIPTSIKEINNSMTIWDNIYSTSSSAIILEKGYNGTYDHNEELVPLEQSLVPSKFRDIVIPLPNSWDDNIRKGIVAGRCSSQLSVPKKDGNFVQIDVTSEYPYVAGERLYPIGEAKELSYKKFQNILKKWKKEELDLTLVMFIIHVKIKQTETFEKYKTVYYPERGSKQASGQQADKEIIDEMEGDEDIIEVGRLNWSKSAASKEIESWIPTITYIDLMNSHAEVELIKDEGDNVGYIWDQAGYVFTSYMTQCKKGKLEEDAKPEKSTTGGEERNLVRREMEKLKLNSVTGKVIQKKHHQTSNLYTTSEKLIKDIQKAEKESRKRGEELKSEDVEPITIPDSDNCFCKLPKFYGPQVQATIPAQLGIFIYAYARSHMWNCVFKHSSSIGGYNYTDTDSAIPDVSYLKNLEKYNLMGKRFGKFGIDGYFKQITVISPKFYYLERIQPEDKELLKELGFTKEEYISKLGKKYITTKIGKKNISYAEAKYSAKGISKKDRVEVNGEDLTLEKNTKEIFEKLTNGETLEFKTFQFRKDLKKNNFTYATLSKQVSAMI